MQAAKKERLEWAAAFGADFLVLATGITIILIAQYSTVADFPWTYVGFAITAIGLVGWLAFGIANADRASHQPQQRPR